MPQTITISIPENVYKRFQQVAKTVQQPLEEVVVQSIQGNLPPSVEDIPAEWQSEFSKLPKESTEHLWQIAREELSPTHWKRHKTLLKKNQTDELNPREQKELQTLREQADWFMFRRSFALALLKWRGISITAPETSA
jgi:hypothetical protein